MHFCGEKKCIIRPERGPEPPSRGAGRPRRQGAGESSVEGGFQQRAGRAVQRRRLPDVRYFVRKLATRADASDCAALPSVLGPPVEDGPADERRTKVARWRSTVIGGGAAAAAGGGAAQRAVSGRWPARRLRWPPHKMRQFQIISDCCLVAQWNACPVVALVRTQHSVSAARDLLRSESQAAPARSQAAPALLPSPPLSETNGVILAERQAKNAQGHVRRLSTDSHSQIASDTQYSHAL